uniref:Uncharacterized protein n=1 Tax=Rhizophora mucronata TaxID=61149 RepID=A0A2P2KBK9_RHIMU
MMPDVDDQNSKNQYIVQLDHFECPFPCKHYVGQCIVVCLMQSNQEFYQQIMDHSCDYIHDLMLQDTRQMQILENQLQRSNHHGLPKLMVHLLWHSSREPVEHHSWQMIHRQTHIGLHNVFQMKYGPCTRQYPLPENHPTLMNA